MNELAQILKHEENNESKLLLAEEKAKQEIEQRKEALKHKLETEPVLEESEKANVLKQKELQMNKIARETEQELLAQMKDLEEKKEKNISKAVDYIIKKSFEI